MSRSGAAYLLPGQALIAPTMGSGNFYHSQAATATATIANPADATMRAVPFWVPEFGRVFDRIAITTTLAAAAGGVFRMGVYTNKAGFLPGALVLDAGTVDATAAPATLLITISLTVGPGVFWLAGVPQGAAATQATYRAINNPLALVGLTTVQSSTTAGYLSAAGAVAGALPDPAPASSGSITSPFDVNLRAA